MSKNQFTGTAMQPQRKRKLGQFNKDQYCICFWYGTKLYAFVIYCAYHVLIQSNIRRYYFYFLSDQAHILLEHLNVSDDLCGEISTGFDKR